MYKIISMSQSKVGQSVCRVTKSLPSGQGKVTIGSGLLVLLKSESGESVNFITTTQVVTKNYLLSEGGAPITAEFLGRKGILEIELNFSYKDVAESIPDPIPGRVLQDTESENQQVSFIVIPIEKFDSRRWYRKLWKRLDHKRAIPCSHRSDDNLQTAMSNRQVLCHVICDDRKSGEFFLAEPSCLSFGMDTSDFSLSSASDSDSVDHVKSIKDLPKEEKPKGAPLLDADGKFVGMLAVSSSEERKLYPVFLPNLDKDRPTSTLSKDERNSASESYAVAIKNEIAVKFDKSDGCSAEATGRQNNGPGNGNKQPESENTDEGGHSSPAYNYSALQGSSNPASNPLQSDNELQPDSNPNDENQEEVLAELGEDPEAGSQEDLEEPFDDRQVSSESQDSSSTNPEHDHLQNPSDHERAGDQNSCLDQSSASTLTSQPSPSEVEEDPSNGSEKDVVDHTQLDGLENPNLQGSACARPVLTAPDSHHEQSSELNQDETLVSINENVHDQQSQNPDLQRRPNLTARQHSYYDQLTGSAGLQYHADAGIPTEVSDPTPKKFDESSFTERSGQDFHTEAERVRSQSDLSDLSSSAASSQTDQVDHTPITRRYSSKQLEHVHPGSFVKEKIVSKASVMDALALHLDRSVTPGKRSGIQLTQRWEHLADEFKVADKIKRRCQNYAGNLSPSEAMFNYLCTTNGSLSIKTLKTYLRELGRNDVVTELEEGSILGNATVTNLCDLYPDTLCNVCLKLDDKRVINNWKDLGLKIGINGASLLSFKAPSDESPTEVILKKIETLKPRLPIVKIKEVLKNLKLSTVAAELNNLPVGSTIQTLLDERDVLEKVSTLLDLDENNWFSFGRKLEIPRKELESLKPEGPQSPTKLLMEHIVVKESDLNMRSFLKSLANIKRFDVIEELKEFFYARDIDYILPLAGSPPQ